MSNGALESREGSREGSPCLHGAALPAAPFTCAIFQLLSRVHFDLNNMDDLNNHVLRSDTHFQRHACTCAKHFRKNAYFQGHLDSVGTLVGKRHAWTEWCMPCACTHNMHARAYGTRLRVKSARTHTHNKHGPVRVEYVHVTRSLAHKRCSRLVHSRECTLT